MYFGRKTTKGSLNGSQKVSVKLGTSEGADNPSFKKRTLFHLVTSQSEDDPTYKKETKYFLNEKGLFEEIPKGVSGIEIISEYNTQGDSQIPVQVKFPRMSSNGEINYATYSIDELITLQFYNCEQRKQLGAQGPEIGFVYLFPRFDKFVPFLDFLSNYSIIKEKSNKEKIKRRVEIANRSRWKIK